MLILASLSSFLVLCFSLSLGWNILNAKKEHSHREKVENLTKIIRDATLHFSFYLYAMSAAGLLLLGVLLIWILGWSSFLGVALGGLGAIGVSYLTTILGTHLNGCIAISATKDLKQTVKTVMRSGFAIGLIGPACATLLVCLLLFISIYFLNVGKDMMIITLISFGLSSSVVSMLGRTSGGIFTKGADVGADLTGKLEKKLPEDDPRNPAVIADAAGDNVGDGIGSILDMFDSTIITFVVCALIAIFESNAFIPFMSYATTFLSFALIFSVLLPFWINIKSSVSKTCDTIFLYGLGSVILASLFTSIIIGWGDILILTDSNSISGYDTFVLSLGGFFATFLVYFNTRYFTGNAEPVLSIARAYKEGGTASGLIVACYRALTSTMLPILAIVFVSWWSYSYASWMGIAIVTLGVLSLVGILASLDAIGPATDNAAGIAEMTGMPSSAREHLDTIDVAGNTTKAVTKSYSILLAALIAISILGIISTNFVSVEILPLLQIGGALLGFLLSAFIVGYLMISVQHSAVKVMEEVRRQFTTIKGLVDGNAKPNYDQVLSILTKSSFYRGLIPFILIFFFVPCAFHMGALLVNPKIGIALMMSILFGFLLSSVFMGLLLTAGGGMLDNSKKYVEAGHFGGKGSPTHEASIIGDILGDPLKDTSGPALSTALKMLFMMSLFILIS